MDFQQQQQPQQPQPAPTYGFCDSYFVDSHDDTEGMFARAAAERERQRGLAKQRQKELAQNLSQLTAEEYQEDVLDHMEFMEGETMPDLQSIEIQTEVQWYMRPYLLDFLLEAHHAFALLPETLHLAVNLLDRYCSRRVVYKRHYQLVGCAALLIAAKYGDRKERVPTIRELKSMCCSLYDDDMFTQMEWHVLETLKWIIGSPTVTGFLQMALTEVAFDPELEHMSWYITELALYHKDFIPVRPSVMARSALALSRCILARPQPAYSLWSTQYDANVVLSLSNYLNTPSQALQRKYASPHLSSVSTRIDIFLREQAQFAQRAVHTPVQDLHAMDIERVAPSTSFLMPQTPQKPGYPTMMAGVLTPPITPDKDHCTQGYGNNQNLVPRMAPCEPTPPSSAEHQHYTNYTVDVPQHYQPQFAHQATAYDSGYAR